GLPIVLAALLIASAVWSGDFVEHDHDEGLFLAMAQLFKAGYPFYSSIFSDQPPLFPVLVAFWSTFAGASLTSARILVALFSFLLVMAVGRAVLRQHGALAAILACLLLLTSSGFLTASSSAMMGNTALAAGILSILAALAAGKELRPWLIVYSGLLMGC